MKKKGKPPFTKGQINKVIDTLCHPQFKRHLSFIIIDGVLHTLNEQNIEVSTRKFLRYSLPRLIKELAKKTR